MKNIPLSPSKLHLIRELQERLLEKEGSGWFRVISGSMRPLIAVQDRVLVKSVPPAALRTGDIVLFKEKDIWVTHRIIKILQSHGNTMFLQKGDAGAVAGIIKPESIMGMVTAIEKNGRVIDLSQGWPRLVNCILGLRHRFFSGFETRLQALKMRLREMPFGWLLKWPYRLIARPWRFLEALVVGKFLR